MIGIRRLAILIVSLVGLTIPSLLFAASTDGAILTGAGNQYSRLCTNEASNDNCDDYTRVNWHPTSTHSTNPVVVSDTGLSGYIWSEALGWINLAPTTEGVHNTTAGVLSGYAWSQTSSWINFAPAEGGVTIDPATGEFSGRAWVSDYGWMLFDCSKAEACVKTTWPVVADTICHDPLANNNGGPLPCTYDNNTVILVTVPLCEDTHAINYHGPAPCQYATLLCEDSHAINFLGPSPCRYSDELLCEDSHALNYHDPAPCRYATLLCEDSGALNYLGPAPCRYTQTLCEDSNAVNYHGPAPCRYVDIFCHDPNATNNGGALPCMYLTTTCTGPDCNNHIETFWEKLKKVVISVSAETASHTASVVGLVGSAAITLTTSLFLDPLALSDLFLIPLRLWSLLLSALGLAKRKKPWGTVYDSVTKRPLDPAYVVLRNIEGKDVATAITDLDGRYGFVAPEPGAYTLVVHKTNYLFPSQKLVGHDHDELYFDLYFGEHFSIASAGEVVTRNIPMDPERFDWNEFAKRQQHLTKFYSLKEKWLLRISNIFFAIGFSVSSVTIIAWPTKYNIIIFCLYILLFFIRTYGLHSRPFGHVISSNTGLPIPFAIIRITQTATGVEIMHRVTDMMGKYYCLLPNGEYSIRVDRKREDGSYETMATKIAATVTKGYLSQRLVVANPPANAAVPGVPAIPAVSAIPASPAMPSVTAPHLVPKKEVAPIVLTAAELEAPAVLPEIAAPKIPVAEPIETRGVQLKTQAELDKEAEDTPLELS